MKITEVENDDLTSSEDSSVERLNVEEGSHVVEHSTELLEAENAKRFKRMAQLTRDIIAGKKNNLESAIFPSVFRNIDNERGRKLREAARTNVEQRLIAENLNDNDFELFLSVIKKYSNRKPPKLSFKLWQNHENELRETGQLKYDFYLDFICYQKSVQELGPKFKKLLTAKLFNEILMDGEEYAKETLRVPTLLVYNYLHERMSMQNLWFALSGHDYEGCGFITEGGLTDFFQEIFALQKKLQELEPELHSYYYAVITRRVFFFLDYQQKQKVRIIDIIASLVLNELNATLENEIVFMKEMNWFALGTSAAIFQHFSNLDTNKNGLLSKAEFLKFNLSLIDPQGPFTQLTSTFVDQLFIETNMYNNGKEMDFRSFVDFVLAMAFIKEPQSISYFIRILDCGSKKKGYLDESDFYYLLKEILDKQKRNTDDPVTFVDIKNELFDIVKPENPTRFTKSDLVKCVKPVLRVLIDLEGYKSDEIFGSVSSVSSPPPDIPKHFVQDTDATFVEHISQMQILKHINVPPPISLEEEERIEEEKKTALAVNQSKSNQ